MKVKKIRSQWDAESEDCKYFITIRIEFKKITLKKKIRLFDKGFFNLVRIAYQIERYNYCDVERSAYHIEQF